MDSMVYISLLQDRLFLALGAMLGALVLDSLKGVAFRHHTDPRPLFEYLAAFVMAPLAARLNRDGRAPGALVMRGVFVLALGIAVFALIFCAGHVVANNFGYAQPFALCMLALSIGTVGWFAPLKALARALNNPKAPRPYFTLARATYTNLVPLDDHAIIRVALSAALRSLLLRLAGPIVVYVLGGLPALMFYWPIVFAGYVLAREGTDPAFGVSASALASVLLFIPAILLTPVVLIALFFSAGASFFKSLGGVVRIVRWPPLLQGGAPLLLAAYAMGLMLGGPRQDSAGNAVPAMWVGPKNGTAKASAQDIGRVLYMFIVSLFLIAVALYLPLVLV